MNFSKHGRKSELPISQDSEIHLFSQFFVSPVEFRHSEIVMCLEKNAENPHIAHIHLLNERIYTTAEMGVESPKIIQYDNSGKRLTFQDVIQYIRNNDIRGYLIFANSDIIFDNTLENLTSCSISESSGPKEMFALLRHEYDDDNIENSKLFGPRIDSQDTWIFHSNNFITEFQERIFDIEFGRAGCDNKIAYLLNIIGYSIINDPLFIKTYHIHKSSERTHIKKDTLPVPYSMVIPSNYPTETLVSILGPELMNEYNGITKIGPGDNCVLRDYIAERFAESKPFIIPRMSDLENNYAHLGRLRKEDGGLLKHNFTYLERYCHSMKKYRGIKAESIKSIVKFSDMYLDAFENCAMYSTKESWLTANSLSKSELFIHGRYSAGRKIIWVQALDTYNYIYDSPWTHALRGKRVLVVSSFAESIQEQISIREKLYGIDLFPECAITTILPPQTQGDNVCRMFDIELEDFFRKLDDIKDTYDIALVSCGGYGNPVCNYIYKSGKSAIYVGATIQMMFGILGDRWVKQYQDIVKLYQNEHWCYPTPYERMMIGNAVTDYF